jgi:hypothetical protein
VKYVIRIVVWVYYVHNSMFRFVPYFLWGEYVPYSNDGPIKCIHNSDMVFLRYWQLLIFFCHCNSFMFVCRKWGVILRFYPKLSIFSSPVTKWQGFVTGWAFVTAIVRRPSVVRPSVRKLLLYMTSPHKPLSLFHPNFTGMFLWWSPLKIVQRI